MYKYFVSSTAIVEDSVTIGNGAKVWHFAHVRSDVNLGTNVIIGDNVYIGPRISVGDNSKIQNNSLIYEPAQIGNGVFIGPGVIFTNDHNPRAINPNEMQKSSARQTGWVGKDGVKLYEQSSKVFRCPVSNKLYHLEGSNLVEVV